MSLDGRIRLAVRREGVGGALRLIVGRGARLAVCSEDHVWYVRDLASQRPHVPLAPGLELRRLGSAESEVLAQIPNVTASESRMRIEAGHDLWAVLEGQSVLFSCSIFRGQVPAIAAPEGWLPLPRDTVCLEDSMTAPAARRQEIASAAVSGVFDALAREGRRFLLTKVAVDNVPTRRAAEKMGFEALALMRFRRVGPFARTSLKEVEGARRAALRGQIEQGLGIAPRSERQWAAPPDRAAAAPPHA